MLVSLPWVRVICEGKFKKLGELECKKMKYDFTTAIGYSG